MSCSGNFQREHLAMTYLGLGMKRTPFRQLTIWLPSLVPFHLHHLLCSYLSYWCFPHVTLSLASAAWTSSSLCLHPPPPQVFSLKQVVSPQQASLPLRCPTASGWTSSPSPGLPGPSGASTSLYTDHCSVPSCPPPGLGSSGGWEETGMRASLPRSSTCTGRPSTGTQ